MRHFDNVVLRPVALAGYLGMRLAYGGKCLSDKVLRRFLRICPLFLKNEAKGHFSPGSGMDLRNFRHYGLAFSRMQIALISKRIGLCVLIRGLSTDIRRYPH